MILGGARGNLMETSLDLADTAFEVLLGRNVYIQPVPIWECDWQNPAGHPDQIRLVADYSDEHADLETAAAAAEQAVHFIEAGERYMVGLR